MGFVEDCIASSFYLHKIYQTMPTIFVLSILLLLIFSDMTTKCLLIGSSAPYYFVIECSGRNYGKSIFVRHMVGRDGSK